MQYQIKQNLFSYGSNYPVAKQFYRHMHNEYEILYFIQGDVDYSIEGVMYHLRPRDLLIIRPRAFHYCYPLTSAKYERFVLTFTDDDLKPPIREFLKNAVSVFNVPENSIVDNLFQHFIAAEKSFSKEELEIYLTSLVDNIVLFLKHTPVTEEKSIPGKKNSSFATILRYIDENPTEDITAARLSEIFFVSKSWILHSCRERLGVGFSQYVNRKRILFAQTMLKKGESPSAVAEKCSFESYSTFYRHYKNVLGHSPKADVPKD